MCDIKVLSDIGSDHFPVYGKFQFAPAAESLQEKEAPEAEDVQEAKDKIAEAEPIQEVVKEKYSEPKQKWLNMQASPKKMPVWKNDFQTGISIL